MEYADAAIMRTLYLNRARQIVSRRHSGSEVVVRARFSTDEIGRCALEIVERDGYYWIPMNIDRWVQIPDHLRTAF